MAESYKFLCVFGHWPKHTNFCVTFGQRPNHTNNFCCIRQNIFWPNRTVFAIDLAAATIVMLANHHIKITWQFYDYLLIF
jgi:hypothetical protein